MDLSKECLTKRRRLTLNFEFLNFSDQMMIFHLDSNLLLSLYWLAISAGVLLPGIWLLIEGKCDIILLERFYLFGKLKNAETLKKKLFTDVPKRYFLHFYLVGLLINIPLLIIFRCSIFLSLLFLLHMCRRLYECLFIHQWNDRSQMSFIHYFIGLIHYPCVGLTIITDHFYPHRSPAMMEMFVALMIFVSTSSIQYRVHLTLANNRRKTNEQIYPIPTGYWPFDYFSCPNYIAEMFIYLSFLLVSHRSSAMMSLIIWVIVNQSYRHY